MPESLGEHTFARQLAPLRAQPSEEAEQVTQALRGEPLSVLAEQKDWIQVETAYAYPGWARRRDLGGEPDGEWLHVVAVDPVEHARTLLGARYEWGGMTSAGIDCSGLVHMAYRRSGRLVPRDAHQQEDEGLPVREDELGAGDLITYGPADGRADHVAFWLGEGRILHATQRDGVLITYGPSEGAEHIAFWVGDGRILHSTQRDGVDGVVEEEEPAELRERRRALVQLVRGER